jgi:hypothetical protein
MQISLAISPAIIDERQPAATSEETPEGPRPSPQRSPRGHRPTIIDVKWLSASPEADVSRGKAHAGLPLVCLHFFGEFRVAFDEEQTSCGFARGPEIGVKRLEAQL